MSKEQPHILIVGEKWCDCIPTHGPTNSSHSFWGPLEACGLASYNLFHFDEYYLAHKRSGDAALINLCREVKPDVIFLIWILHPENHYNPKLETLLTLRQELGIPIIAWWGDTQANAILEMAELLSTYVDFTYVGDSTTSFSKVKDQHKFGALPHPKDPRIFNDPGLARDINVSFIGSVNRVDRQDALEQLRRDGIEVFQTGGQREVNLPISDYARMFMRSLLTLNLNNYEGKPGIINGRIFEATLCGTLLLDPEWSDTHKWFEPMRDYVPYRDHADLVQKIRYYLAHPIELQTIAQQGRNTAKELYTGAGFWSKIIEQARKLSKPDVDAAAINLALSKARQGKVTEATGLLYRQLAMKPDLGEAWSVLATVLEENDQYDEAIQALNHINPQERGSIECSARLAQLHVAVGRTQEARKLLESVLARTSTGASSQARSSLIDALMKCEMFDQAVAIMVQTIQAASPDHRLLGRLVEALFRIGRVSDAETVLQESIAVHGQSIELNQVLVEMFNRLGKPERAAQHKWVLLRPEQRTSEALKQQLQILELKGDIRTATELLKRYLSFRSDSDLEEKLKVLERPALETGSTIESSRYLH